MTAEDVMWWYQPRVEKCLSVCLDVLLYVVGIIYVSVYVSVHAMALAHPAVGHYVSWWEG